MSSEKRASEKVKPNSIFGLPSEFMVRPVEAWREVVSEARDAYTLHQLLTYNTNRSRKTGSGNRLYDPFQALVAEASGRNLRELVIDASNTERSSKNAQVAVDLLTQHLFRYAKDLSKRTEQTCEPSEPFERMAYPDYVNFCAAELPFLKRFFESGDCPPHALMVLVPLIHAGRALKNSDDVECRPGLVIAVHMLLLSFGDDFFKMIRIYPNVFRDLYPEPDAWPTSGEQRFPENPDEVEQFVLTHIKYGNLVSQFSSRLPILYTSGILKAHGLSRTEYLHSHAHRVVYDFLEEHYLCRVKDGLLAAHELLVDIKAVLGEDSASVPSLDFATIQPLERPLPPSAALFGTLMDFHDDTLLSLGNKEIAEARIALTAVKSKLDEIQQITATQSSLQSLGKIQALMAEIEPAREILLGQFEAFSDQVLRIQEGFRKLNAGLAAAYEAAASKATFEEPEPNTDAAEQEVVQKLRATIEDLQTEKRIAQEELVELRERNFKLKTQLNIRESCSEVAPPAGAVTREHLQQLIRIDEFTVAQTLELFADMYPSAIELMPSAIESAMTMEGFNQPKRLAAILDRAVNDYLPDFLIGGDNKARSHLGGVYSAKESDYVHNCEQARRQREFVYRGEKRMFERHLRVGYGTGQQSLRLYFDVIDGRLVFAYAGEHLDCYSTN